MSHAVGHLLDEAEVLAHIVEPAQIQQADRVVGKGMYGGQGLIHFMADARGHLAENGEFPSLNRAVARFAQDAFGGFQRIDFFFERDIGGPQVRGTFGNALFKFLVGPAQAALPDAARCSA